MVEAVAQYFSTLEFLPGDGRVPLLHAARKLADLFDTRATAEVSRELRQLLHAVEELTPAPSAPGILEDLVRRRDERRAQSRRQVEDA
jgi:hypothetical protein